MDRPPLIGVTCDLVPHHGLDWHGVQDKYIRPVAVQAGGVPVLLPALADVVAVDAWLDRLDGVVLTGAVSNVHPGHYGQPPSPAAEPHDPARDAVTLPLIRGALARGLPLFGICRGFQELNVALGGTLHPRLHELADRADHRRPDHPDLAVQYGPRHPVNVVAGGRLAALVGAGRLTVNSLHHQGIDRLAPGLVVEATADDGTIEAVSVAEARTFALAVQWHPEWRTAENPASLALYRAFGAACRGQT